MIRRRKEGTLLPRDEEKAPRRSTVAIPAAASEGEKTHGFGSSRADEAPS